MRDLEISRSCLQGYVGIIGEGKGKWQYMKNGYLIDSGFSYIVSAKYPDGVTNT